MSLSALRRLAITVALVVLAISTTPIRSLEATQGQFTTANESVNSAYSLVYHAEQNGGDISALVEKLNVAIFLIQKAQSENATNPRAVTDDLSNATGITQIVSMSSAPVSSNGSLARQLRLYESLGTIAATLSVATLAYLKGDRAYRRLWLYVYKKHLVENTDE